MKGVGVLKVRSHPSLKPESYPSPLPAIRPEGQLGFGSDS
jgi:hypothetical protein